MCVPCLFPTMPPNKALQMDPHASRLVTISTYKAHINAGIDPLILLQQLPYLLSIISILYMYWGNTLS